MKGVIALCLKELVVEGFGANKWQEIITHAGHQRDPMILPISDIDDNVVLGLVDSTCQVLGITIKQAADAFGDYWVNNYSQKMYQAYYEGAASSKDMILKMDHVHLMVTKYVKNAQPPRFAYEWEDDRTLIMQYKSHRNLVDMLVGLVKGVGKLYNEDLTVTRLNDETIRIIFAS